MPDDNDTSSHGDHELVEEEATDDEHIRELMSVYDIEKHEAQRMIAIMDQKLDVSADEAFDLISGDKGQ